MCVQQQEWDSKPVVNFAGRPSVIEELCVKCAISKLLVSTLPSIGSQLLSLEIREYSGLDDEHKVAGSSIII